ncbi:MAG TPA: LLM class flavin-dependent oxidoreductase [Steroidobacteraceae bacterium]|jgi:luciferase family oxidoreductase group 1|nr:LLM class flavin-dependent oxidoreductase [Steroidobacteraceae bacterium]
MTLQLSVLDLAPVPEGVAPAAALRRTVDLAQLADRLGFVRYWFAEHHSMPSVGSSSPELLIGYAAGATKRIRVGSGGIMLPNHAPLRIAEAFRTLEALYPGRIDLGLGRAPGSDQNASRALRSFDGEQFPYLLSELIAFNTDRFPATHPFRAVRAVPDDVPLPPIFLLGSSGASARMAGEAGMGYSFASHFSSASPAPPFAAYRDSFVPSAQFPRPLAILGVAVCCAATDAEAQYHAATMRLAWLRIRSGRFLPLPSPEEALSYAYTAAELATVKAFEDLVIVGNPQTVRAGIEARVAECQADEVMIVSNLHSHEARLQSYELLAAEVLR